MKRTINGTHESVALFHLFRCVDEQAFRFNNRKPMDDADGFSYAVCKIVGKRIMYQELTGKTGENLATSEIFWEPTTARRKATRTIDGLAAHTHAAANG